jgi:hypothetical protein
MRNSLTAPSSSLIVERILNLQKQMHQSKACTSSSCTNNPTIAELMKIPRYNRRVKVTWAKVAAVVFE